MSSRSVSLNHAHDEKILLKESSVQLTSLTDLISTHRVLSLYPATLVISKLKGGTFKTKEKVKIEKVWISNGSQTDAPFILGWPICNYLVHFNSSQEKEEWYGLLTTTIGVRLKQASTTIIMSILVPGRNQKIRKRVDNGKKAGEIISETRDELSLPANTTYDLKVQIGEGALKLALHGPENVYALIMHQLDRTGMRLSETDRSSLDACISIVPVRLILSQQRTSRPSPHEILSSIKRRLSRSESKSVFGRSLEGRAPPQPILSIMDHLRMHSMDVEGLFRKSPKQSTARQLRTELERGVVPDFNKYNAHVLAATLKDYLRSIPNKLLLNGNYDKWMKDVVDEADKEKKLSSASSLLSLLPIAHATLLSNLLKLLAKVASTPETLMTSSSLAVCLAPSFLEGEDAASSKKVPDLIKFLIDHAERIALSLSSSGLTISEVDINSNEVSMSSPWISSPSPLLSSSCLTSPQSARDLQHSQSHIWWPHSSLTMADTSFIDSPSSSFDLADTVSPSTHIFRSKALRDSGMQMRDKKEPTPRSPCLKRIHFNAHLKGGIPSRPSIVYSDSDSDTEQLSHRPLARSTVDVPRKTSLDSTRNDRFELLKRNEEDKRKRETIDKSETTKEVETDDKSYSGWKKDTVFPCPMRNPEAMTEDEDELPPSVPPPVVPPTTEPIIADRISYRYGASKGKEDKPTVQVMPFRAPSKEKEEIDERDCKVSRSHSHRSTEDRSSGTTRSSDIHRTSSVLRERSRRISTLKTDPICVGLDSLEINWSVAQLKRRFQERGNKPPEINTHVGE